jgi:hypothetical protein
VGVYYSDAIAYKYSPWLLLAGPLAYLLFRRPRVGERSPHA